MFTMMMRGAIVKTLLGTAAILGGAWLYAKHGPRRHRPAVGMSTGLVLGHEYGTLAGLALGGPAGAVVGGAAGGVAGAVVGLQAAGDGPPVAEMASPLPPT